jgi:tRNA A37 N6-isopentenylltransferase MiaA
MGNLTAGQQAALTNLANTAATARSTDLARQQSALQQIATLAQQEQGLRAADVASLEAAGASQQAQQQRQYDAAYQQFAAERDYARQQAEWLNNQLRGIAPITPTTQTSSTQATGQAYSPSGLTQLAQLALVGRGLQNLG